ncbi:MAG TPA: DUF929 family protein [Nitrososphaera sp.]|nr:DUF929 family protein [Nitrososphaera sp.]
MSSSFVPKRVVGKFMHVTDQPLKRPGGKSLVYFMGAGFCPFCAAERWAIVKALERFGKWEGVAEDKSADHDEKYLNVPTFNLARAKYASDTVEFAGKETADRNFDPMQELDDKDYEILDMYNPDQMIPFLLVDGQYMQVGAGYSPELIQNMTHDKVEAELSNPNSAIGKAINVEIDNITALICKATGGRGKEGEKSACNSDSIRALVAKL